MKLIVETDQKTIDECKKLFAEGYSNNAEYAIANGKPYEERSKGEWIDSGVSAEGILVFRCSVCRREIASNCLPQDRSTKYPFCNCGADMRGE